MKYNYLILPPPALPNYHLPPPPPEISLRHLTNFACHLHVLNKCFNVPLRPELEI